MVIKENSRKITQLQQARMLDRETLVDAYHQRLNKLEGDANGRPIRVKLSLVPL